MKTCELPLRVTFPDCVSGAVVDSAEGIVGLLNIAAGHDTMRLAFGPTQVRQLAALCLNIADEMER